MDIKDIVRVFKFNEMSQKAERDPASKRPPTIKFLGVTLLVAALAVGFGYLVMISDQPDAKNSTGNALSLPTEATNQTASPTPTSGVPAPGPQSGPTIGRHD